MWCLPSPALLLLLMCCRFSHTAVARVSDDYYPRDPASSTPHIGACAFNSLYMGALVQPDWDMFQSAHPAGEKGCVVFCIICVILSTFFLSSLVGQVGLHLQACLQMQLFRCSFGVHAEKAVLCVH
jgi:hypothetical protein